MARPASMTVSRPRGGALEVRVDGDARDRPFVFHGGTPSAVVANPLMAAAAQHAGLRLVTYSRPGYAGSTPAPGRSVAAAAADVAAILDALDDEHFVTMGWSGGGPHALACAALLANRCLAAATVAGVAPYDAVGLDWMDGMAAENVEEFSAAIAGTARLRPLLETYAAGLADLQGPEVAAALGTLVSDVDKAVLTGKFAEISAASLRRSISTGIEGWHDDDLAFAKPWGFELATIRPPVALWQGDQDRMVPFAHGRWLAQHIPGVRAHLQPGEGHLSLGVRALDRIVADLAALGTG